MVKDELLKGLTEEQIAKIKSCKSQEELLELAKEEGIELTEEQLREMIVCMDIRKTLTFGP